jgi:outer membrane protein assembly factor BamE (lipoprotein component of BamABCDE complex)
MHNLLKTVSIFFSFFLLISCKEGVPIQPKNEALLAETNTTETTEKFNPNNFIGLWQTENGESSIRIEKNNSDFLLIWKSKVDNYEPHYINCSVKENQLVGDYYGHKDNLKVEFQNNNLLFTINPFAEFAPIVYQKFTLVNTTNNYVKPNEVELYSFRTFEGKKVSICKDTLDKYLIYRFGTEEKVELEYPNDKSSSWDNFKYYYYLRGSGIQNEGMDENSLSFSNGKYKYEIYDNYTAMDDFFEIGIKVINTENGLVTTLKGELSSQKGSLINLRDYPQLQENKGRKRPKVTAEELGNYLLITENIAGLSIGLNKNAVIKLLGNPDTQEDDGRNEHLGEHFYYFEYKKLNLTIVFNDRNFQNEKKDFKICNINLYGNSKLKTKNNISIGATVEEVKKAYKWEMGIGNTAYEKHDWDDPNLKFIHLGDIDGLNFIFKNDKVFKIQLGTFQWN